MTPVITLGKSLISARQRVVTVINIQNDKSEFPRSEETIRVLLIQRHTSVEVGISWCSEAF
jgi:hypothetical protein